MIIYIGADHRGFALKAYLTQVLAGENAGYEIVDVGNKTMDPTDDYPDFAKAVAEKVSNAIAGGDNAARGIVICGSGFGVDIVANKFSGVRGALAMSPDHMRVGRNDDDVNVLALAADFIKPEEALAIARAFLSTPFNKNEERYVRRINKINNIEKTN